MNFHVDVYSSTYVSIIYMLSWGSLWQPLRCPLPLREVVSRRTPPRLHTSKAPVVGQRLVIHDKIGHQNLEVYDNSAKILFNTCLHSTSFCCSVRMATKRVSWLSTPVWLRSCRYRNYLWRSNRILGHQGRANNKLLICLSRLHLSQKTTSESERPVGHARICNTNCFASWWDFVGN